MYYLIDGYNLLHHVGLLQGRVGPAGLEKARRALLGHLAGRLGIAAANALVVFDATKAPPAGADTLEYQGIQVYFTRYEEADDLIERLIHRTPVPKLLTVVSNDRRIRDAAQRRKCPVVECVEFWASLGQSTTVTAPTPTEGEAKRDRLSHSEVEEWAREFGGLADDPGFKELFDPFDFDTPLE